MPPQDDKDRLHALVGQIVIDEWASIFDDGQAQYAIAKWLNRALPPGDQAKLKDLFAVDVADPDVWNPNTVPEFVRRAHARADRRYLSAYTLSPDPDRPHYYEPDALDLPLPPSPDPLDLHGTRIVITQYLAQITTPSANPDLSLLEIERQISRAVARLREIVACGFAQL